MTPSHYEKGPEFLSRIKPGEDFKDFKKRIIQQLKNKGWIASKEDTPGPTIQIGKEDAPSSTDPNPSPIYIHNQKNPQV